MAHRPRRFARFRRFCRRGLATLLGLWLGWQAAGVAFNQLPSATYADQAPSDAASAPGMSDGAPRHDATAAHGHDGHGHSPAARQLVPGDGQTDWYSSVIAAAIALFVVAVLIGVPLLKLLPPEPEPAPGHDHDHGHDHHEHGHDHHGDHS